MDFKSISDILQFAISKEQASEQFYLDLVEKMKDPAARTVFKVIAKEEKKHAELLELEMIKAGYTVKHENEQAETAGDYEWTESLELGEGAQDMNYADALLLAIQKERASFQLYAQLVGMTEDVQFREILLELAEEEMRHLLQFEREYETISHHKE